MMDAPSLAFVLDLDARLVARSCAGAHLLLATLQLPLQHLPVVVHRRKISLEIGLVARGSIGEVRVSRAVRERLRVCCGVHCERVGVWMNVRI